MSSTYDLTPFPARSLGNVYLHEWEIIPFEIFIAFVLLWICWDDTRKINLLLVISSFHPTTTFFHFKTNVNEIPFQLLHRSEILFRISSHGAVEFLRWHVGILDILERKKKRKKNFVLYMRISLLCVWIHSCCVQKSSTVLVVMSQVSWKSFVNLQFSQDYFLSFRYNMKINSKTKTRLAYADGSMKYSSDIHICLSLFENSGVCRRISNGNFVKFSWKPIRKLLWCRNFWRCFKLKRQQMKRAFKLQ